MKKSRAKEEVSSHAARQLLQKGSPDSILVFLVLAIIILAAAVFSSQRLFFQENIEPVQQSSDKKYVWLSGSPDVQDGLYLVTPDQLESKFPGAGSLVSEGAAGPLVSAIQFDADTPRAASLPPPVANIFFQPIPINRADTEILTSLPGVGSVLAERIVQRREEHGPFRAKEELLRIDGIGPKKYAGLVDKITLD